MQESACLALDLREPSGAHVLPLTCDMGLLRVDLSLQGPGRHICKYQSSFFIAGILVLILKAVQAVCITADGSQRMFLF